MSETYLIETCANCGKTITKWDKLTRLFWTPWSRSVSIFLLWKFCCSRKCWSAVLAELEKETDDATE